MTPSQEINPGTCPKCSSPLMSGTKFCETCGAKIEQPPVCVHCGASLTAGIKFCEVCGTPAGAPPVTSPAPAAPPAPAPAEVTVPPEVQLPAAKTTPAEVKIPAPEPRPAPAEKEKVPDKKTPEKQKEPVQKNKEKIPMSRTQTLVIAGVVGLVIVAALAYFVLLPMLSGSGTASKGNSVSSFALTTTSTTPSTGTSAPDIPSSQNTASQQNTASASFVPEPTQIPPAELFVTYQAERDPITGLVTVTFTGGAGKNGVSDVFVKLTRSDGQVLTQTFTPQQIGSYITLEGTRMTDRIEVTANYFNGAKYRIIDQLFEYKKRNL